MNILSFVFFGLLVSVSAHAQQAELDPMLPAPVATPATPAAAAAKPVDETKVKKVDVAASVISITKVVGEVGDQIVTSREVKINSAVDQALNEKPASDGGFKILAGTERAFSGEVSRVLDEWAVFFEARSLGSTTVSKGEVAKVLTVIQERWGSQTAWRDLEAGGEELRTLVERKLAAIEFQKLKSDPALSPISDDEALSYYKKNRLRFGSLPFSTFSENIKAYLVKTQVDRRLSEWHDVLRRKYKTRNFISG